MNRSEGGGNRVAESFLTCIFFVLVKKRRCAGKDSTGDKCGEGQNSVLLLLVFASLAQS